MRTHDIIHIMCFFFNPSVSHQIDIDRYNSQFLPAAQRTHRFLIIFTGFTVQAQNCTHSLPIYAHFQMLKVGIQSTTGRVHRVRLKRKRMLQING